jgi:hypothetical protein
MNVAGGGETSAVVCLGENHVQGTASACNITIVDDPICIEDETSAFVFVHGRARVIGN